MNSSAALSTWLSLSSSYSRTGNGESVTLISCLTTELQTAAAGAASTAASLFSISSTPLTALTVTASSSKVGGAWAHVKKGLWRWRLLPLPMVAKKLLGVLLQLNSYSLAAENWRSLPGTPAWWGWWKMRLVMAFPASLLRRLSMTLRCIISLPFDMPFLNMKKATRIIFHTLFAITAELFSISIFFLIWILEREREICEWESLERRRNGLMRKRGKEAYIYVFVSGGKRGRKNVLVLHLNQPTLE